MSAPGWLIVSVHDVAPPQWPQVQRMLDVHQPDFGYLTDRMRYPDGGEYMALSIYEFAGDLVAHEIDYFAERFPPAEERSALVSVHDMPAEMRETEAP